MFYFFCFFVHPVNSAGGGLFKKRTGAEMGCQVDRKCKISFFILEKNSK